MNRIETICFFAMNHAEIDPINSCGLNMGLGFLIFCNILFS